MTEQEKPADEDQLQEAPGVVTSSEDRTVEEDPKKPPTEDPAPDQAFFEDNSQEDAVYAEPSSEEDVVAAPLSGERSDRPSYPSGLGNQRHFTEEERKERDERKKEEEQRAEDTNEQGEAVTEDRDMLEHVDTVLRVVHYALVETSSAQKESAREGLIAAATIIRQDEKVRAYIRRNLEVAE